MKKITKQYSSHSSNCPPRKKNPLCEKISKALSACKTITYSITFPHLIGPTKMFLRKINRSLNELLHLFAVFLAIYENFCTVGPL